MRPLNARRCADVCAVNVIRARLLSATNSARPGGMGADEESTAAHETPPVGRGWCKTGADVCTHWEQKLVGRLRSAYTLRDIALPESVFGPGHWIRTLDVGAGGSPEAGNAQQKPVVLLIHGFGNGLGVWFLCVDALVAATGLRVTCIDLPGFGLSSRPRFPGASNGSAAEAKFVDAIEAWRKTMQIDSLILCGHSFGGYLAMAYAMRHADRCRHVLLVDPWGLPERDPNAVRGHTSAHAAAPSARATCIHFNTHVHIRTTRY